MLSQRQDFLLSHGWKIFNYEGVGVLKLAFAPQGEAGSGSPLPDCMHSAQGGFMAMVCLIF